VIELKELTYTRLSTTLMPAPPGTAKLTSSGICPCRSEPWSRVTCSRVPAGTSRVTSRSGFHASTTMLPPTPISTVV